jgi:glycosyltransferase involved in cell wall biosynthesis
LNAVGEKKITILHLIDSAGVSGGERYLLDLIKHSNEIFEHIVVLPYSGPFELMLKDRGYRYVIIGLAHKNALPSILALTKCINKNKVDIIHTHGFRANFYGRIAGMLGKIRDVSTIHVSLYDYVDTPFLIRQVYILFERMLSFKTSKFICISKAMANDMIRLGVGENKISLIHNGVDLDRFFPRLVLEEKKRELGVATGVPVIGTIGRMVTEKGQIYLIEALKYLKTEWKDLKCLFVGDGPLRSQLMQMARDFGIEEMCIFTGIREDIEDIYPILDIFVLPSIREPFGLVLLEAMATEVPVIATASGGPLDIIRSGINGILVPPKDSSALANAVIIVLNNKELARTMGLAARKKVEQEFSVEKMVAEAEKVYLSLLKSV